MIAFYDVDTQNDFFPGGSLAVPDADKIKNNLAKITIYAHNSPYILLGSIDCHNVDDKEFKTFPPHCIVGTSGYIKIPETQLLGCSNYSEVPQKLMSPSYNGTPLMFQKKTYDIWDKELGNPNLENFISTLNIDTVIVYGVATNICVLAAVKGFIQRNIKVYIIEDAIKGLYISETNNEQSAISEMTTIGAKLVETKIVTM